MGYRTAEEHVEMLGDEGIVALQAVIEKRQSFGRGSRNCDGLRLALGQRTKSDKAVMRRSLILANTKNSAAQEDEERNKCERRPDQAH